MKAGHVATIRVNPRDCQSVLDVLDVAGVPRGALSFAQCVSLALSSLLETARKSNVIPEPDEFQYLNRMEQYLSPQRRRKAVRVANTLHNLGGEMRAPSLASGPASPGSAAPPAQEPMMTPAEPDDSPVLQEAAERLTTLLIKKEQCEDGFGTWTQADEADYQRCYRIVYPNG